MDGDLGLFSREELVAEQHAMVAVALRSMARNV
jgi:hypothetical protein